jgi:hypothetical protein
MIGNTRVYFSLFLFLAMFAVWPFAAWSQVPPAQSDDATSPRQSSPPSNAVPQVTRDLSQDTQFLALLRTRDREFALLGELRRIVTYHDNFRGRLERVLATTGELGSREQMTKTTNNAIARLQKFESDVKAASDLSAKAGLAKKFDEDFPLTRTELGLPRSSRSSRTSDVRNLALDNSSFIQRERVNANEVFQNISIENREWLTSYEKLFVNIERRLNEFILKLSQLDKLPSSFYELTEADSFDTITEDQLQSAIDQYRTILQATLNDIASFPQPAAIESTKAALMGQVDSLGRNLVAKSSEQNTQFRDLEKSIAGSAKALYGNKVGADSFNYLLIVFAGVFIVIMVMPRFYPAPVAENVLKSEFLLQFSTVFVLVAAIIILAIGELIQKDQLPVLLAGISGYVLGQLGKT